MCLPAVSSFLHIDFTSFLHVKRLAKVSVNCMIDLSYEDVIIMIALLIANAIGTADWTVLHSKTSIKFNQIYCC